MAKVLIPLAAGCEELEAVTIIDLMRRAQLEVVTASLTTDLAVKASRGVTLLADTTLDIVVVADFAMVVMPGGQPGTYLRSRLAGPSGVSALDPSPLFGFGHGLSYTGFGFSDHVASAPAMSTAEAVTVSCTVTNTGAVDGAEVVQLYLEDPVGEVVRPVRELIGFARVELAAGSSASVEFTVHADRTSFTGVDLKRVVTPGLVKLHVATSSTQDVHTHEVILHGERRVVGFDRKMLTPVRITPHG